MLIFKIKIKTLFKTLKRLTHAYLQSIFFRYIVIIETHVNVKSKQWNTNFFIECYIIYSISLKNVMYLNFLKPFVERDQITNRYLVNAVTYIILFLIGT